VTGGSWRAQDEVAKAGEVVRVDQVGAGVMEFEPDCGEIGGGPEPDATALVVGALDEGAQLFTFGLCEGQCAAPGKMEGPVVADEWDEIGGRISIEIGDAAIESCKPDRFGSEQVKGAVTGEDYGDGVRSDGAGSELGENWGITLESPAEDWVSDVGWGLQVDKESERRAVGVDTAVMLFSAVAEGIEVELLEGAFGLGLVAVVGDEELSINEVDIGFHAAEAMVEGIEQGARVLIIVMGMGLGKRGGQRCGQGERGAENCEPEGEPGAEIHRCGGTQLFRRGNSVTRILVHP
jgi:hypothetical protein